MPSLTWVLLSPRVYVCIVAWVALTSVYACPMCVSACCSCVRREALWEAVRGLATSTRTGTGNGTGSTGTGGTTGALAVEARAAGALAGALEGRALVAGALEGPLVGGAVGSAGPPSPSTGRDERPGDRPPPSPRLVSSGVRGWLGGRGRGRGLSFLLEGDDSLEAASDVSPSDRKSVV